MILSGPDIDDPASIAPVDLDSDGDLDLVAACAGSGIVAVFFQSSDGTFSGPLIPGGNLPPEEPQFVRVADVDGDGDLDIVSATGVGQSLRIFLQIAPGQFSTHTVVLDGPRTAGSAVQVDVADLDGDGDQDVVSMSMDGAVTIFFQTSPLQFQVDPRGPLGTKLTGLFGVKAVDMDGDADVDVVVLQAIPARIHIFYGGH